MLIRRSTYFALHINDGSFLAIEQLMQGSVEIAPHRILYAFSILCGDIYPVTMEDLGLLLRIPSDKWMEAAELGGTDDLNNLIHKGLVLVDGGDDRCANLRKRDEELSASRWNLFAALYHFLTRWSDKDQMLQEQLEAHFRGPEISSATAARQFISRFGAPPAHFHAAVGVGERVDLPLMKRDDGLYGLLAKRRTTRGFTDSEPLGVQALATLLYYVWGCHGYAKFADEFVVLKKTSPSGGGLHPIEVYVLIRNVDGISPGSYHYNVEHHGLEPIERLDRAEATALVEQFTAGQSYFREAAVLFVMTARFRRSFWKYRNQPGAYGVVLMDAAHLSQTFYLVCAELGLGCFFTAAINSESVERRLGLDGSKEGALAICGCGRPANRDPELNPDFEPYVPRVTRI